MSVKTANGLDDLDHRLGSLEEQEEDEGTSIDFVTLLHVVRRSIPWVILLMVLGLAGSYLFLRYTKKVYESTSTLKLDEQSEAGVLGLGVGNVDPAYGKLQGEVDLIKSDIVYERLKKTMPLQVSYYVEARVLDAELYTESPFLVSYNTESFDLYDEKIYVKFNSFNQFDVYHGEDGTPSTHTIGSPLNISNNQITINPTPSFDNNNLDHTYYFIVHSNHRLKSYINENLSTSILNPEAKTIQIAFKDFNRYKARDIVNNIDSVYLQHKLERGNQASRQTLNFLNEQLKDTEDSLSKAEDEIERFVRQNQSYDVKSNLQEALAQVQELEKERLELRFQVSLLNTIQTKIENNEDLGAVVAGIEGQTNEIPQLAEQLTELSDLQARLRTQRVTSRGNTLADNLLEEQLNFSQNKLTSIISNSKGLIQAQLDNINRNQSELTGEILQVPALETERIRLERVFGLYEGFYTQILNRRVEYGIAMAGTTPDFQILSPASLPNESTPVYPNVFIVYAIGIAGGLFFGIGLIAARYLMHDTVTNVQELERNTSVPVLGVVPSYDKQKMPFSKLVVNQNPKSALSESIRSIRTNLDFLSSSKKKRIISITSTVSGEGKTFVAANLGGIIAMSGQKVVLLDVDMRKPKVHIALDGENLVGMSTILIDKHTAQEAIQGTSIPGLDFISAGPTPPNPSELIMSPRFDGLLQELQQEYDVIIVDSPPIGLVTDGVLVMRKADIPLYIVRANYSKKAFLKGVDKVMKTHHLTNMATILNDAHSVSMYGYSYGYGFGSEYGYGYYDEEVKPTLGGRLKSVFKK